MSNLVKNQMSDVIAIGKAFAESGMFPDVKSAAQAIVKIQAGKELGIPPFAAMSGIHIIKGKPVIGAGVMGSMVKASIKYDYRVIEHSTTNCAIDFFEFVNGEKVHLGCSSFSIIDARNAGTQNLDKFARNMLFARAMSNGVKWYCPDVFSGPVYVPEDFDLGSDNENVITQHQIIDEQDNQEQKPISDELFNQAIEKVKTGAMLKDGSKSVTAWLIEDVALTENQVSILTTILNSKEV